MDPQDDATLLGSCSFDKIAGEGADVRAQQKVLNGFDPLGNIVETPLSFVSYPADFSVHDLPHIANADRELALDARQL